jgi:hypothetical protein
MVDNNIDDWEVVQTEGIDDWEPVGGIEQPSRVESAIRGAAQGVSFGLSDELIGGGEALGSVLFGEDKLADLGDNYSKYRDESRAANRLAQEANPGTYLAGELAGGIAVPIPGAAALRTGSTIAKVGKGALAGAGVGALEAAGRTEESLASAEGLKDVAGGALLGGAIGGVVPAIGAAGSKLREKYLNETSVVNDITESLPTTPTQRHKELLNPQLIEKKKDAVREGIRAGVLGKAGPISMKDAVKQTQKELKNTGIQLKNAAESVDEAVADEITVATFYGEKYDWGLKFKEVNDQLMDGLIKKRDSAELSSSEFKAAKGYVKESLRVLETEIAKNPSAILKSIRKIRGGMDRKLRRQDFQPGGTKVGTKRDNVKHIADGMRRLELDYIANISVGPGKARNLLDDYKSALGRYSNLKTLEDELAKVKDVDFLNTQEVLTGILAGGIGGGIGLGGIGLAAAHKFMKYKNTPQGQIIIKSFLSSENVSPMKLKTAASNFAKRFGISTEQMSKLTTPEKRAQFVKALEQQAVSSTTEE